MGLRIAGAAATASRRLDTLYIQYLPSHHGTMFLTNLIHITINVTIKEKNNNSKQVRKEEVQSIKLSKTRAEAHMYYSAEI